MAQVKANAKVQLDAMTQEEKTAKERVKSLRTTISTTKKDLKDDFSQVGVLQSKCMSVAKKKKASKDAESA
jgi:hypothetical protein